MNILYTAYYGLGKGGAEVSMSLLASALRDKHNIIIASSEDYKGIKTYKLSKLVKYIPSFKLQNDYMVNFFSRVIEKENIKIIHSHDSKTAFAAIIAAKKKGIKAVTHYRDYWFCCQKSSLLKPDLSSCENCDIETLKRCSNKSRLLWDIHKLNYLEKIRNVLKEADAKIAISNAINDKLKVIGITDAKVIANGIDLKMFKGHEKHNFSDVVIGYIGSLSYNKGLQNISSMIKEILMKHAKVKFVVIGDGELKNKLIEDFKDFKERVIFKGNISYDDMADAYNEIDAVLIPSIWQEPFSRVAIESMAAGKPIIAANVGGLKHIIKNDFGFLINNNKPDEWQDAMEIMVSKPIKRRLMGLNAIKEAKNYDINKIAEYVDVLYIKLK